MRIAIFDDYRFGLVSQDGATVRDATTALLDHDTAWPWAFVPHAIERFAELRPRLEEAVRDTSPRPVNAVRVLPPVPWPGQIVAAAANYHEHHREMAARRTTVGESLQGEVFLKAPSSIVGHGATVTLPNVPGREIHYEAELAAVVGRPMKDVAPRDALDYVFGYTCLMDLTVRGSGDRSRRKSYEGFTPLGPWIVTADEVPDPQDLAIRLWRNGDLRQDGHTRDMVYPLAEMLAYASSVMRLYPGDILATGTPAGVGAVQPGDRVEMELERVGRLAVTIAGPREGAPIAEPGLGSPHA